jgi:hypothetical protein
MRVTLAIVLIALTGCTLAFGGCANAPFTREKSAQEQEDAAKAKAQKATTRRFETCMDSTLASFGPISFATQEARLKAAEICKDVMKQ